MYNIAISSQELDTLISSLYIEAFRIRQYYAAITQTRTIADVSRYDDNRLKEIETLAEKLKKVQGGTIEQTR